MGDKIDLSAPQQITAPQATWFELIGWTVNLGQKTIEARYVWHSADGVIPVNGAVEQTAMFCNNPDDPETPADETNNEYNAIYRETIVAGDVDKRVGKLFKTKLLNKLTTRILSAGITITDND